MLGLLFILAGLVYLGISILAVFLAGRFARKHEIAGWKLGVPTGLIMFLFLFWDYVPTVVAYKYYCDNEAEFTVYKTLEQWEKENPNAAATLSNTQSLSSIRVDGKIVHRLNSRFHSVFELKRVFLSVKRIHNYVLDVQKNEVLAQYVDFSSGRGSGGVSITSLQDVKFWLSNSSCDKEMIHRKQFGEFVNSLERLPGLE